MGFNIFRSQRQAARSDWIELAAQLQHCMHGFYARKWTEVFAAVANELARGKNPWEWLFFNNDIGVGLVIFELDVINGFVLLDEAILQQ